jgi:hypothetical protein
MGNGDSEVLAWTFDVHQFVHLPGLLFENHSTNYVTDGDVEADAKEQQAREAVGSKESARCKTEEEPRDETPVKLKYLCLPSLGNKGVNSPRNDGNYIMDEKSAYMDYSEVEVGKIGPIGVVMNDEEDGKDQMIDVEMEMEMDKNG